MTTDGLLSYIKMQLLNGESVPDITKTLREHGWSEQDIIDALYTLKTQQSQEQKNQ